MIFHDPRQFLDLVDADPIEALTGLQLYWKHLEPDLKRRQADGLAMACVDKLWADGVEFMLAHWPSGQPVPASLGAGLVRACREQQDRQGRERAETLASALLLEVEWERQALDGPDLESLVLHGPHGLMGLPTVFDRIHDHLTRLPSSRSLDLLDRAGRMPGLVHSPLREQSYRSLARLRHGVLERTLAPAGAKLALARM